jgi:TolB protein
MKYNTSPVWSIKDRIVFSGSNNGHFDVYAINPDGTGLRQLTDGQRNNEDPCWSPDGRYIVFSSDRDGGYHLYIMNEYGQNQRRITLEKGDQTTPTWSPY